MSSLSVLLDQNNIPSEDPSQGEGPSEPIQVPFIDLVENDDDDDDNDVVESSPRSFYQARANARINRRRTAVNLSLENQTEVPCLLQNENISVNLEANASVELQNAKESPETNQEVVEPSIEKAEPPIEEAEPPIEEAEPEPPKVVCPICMDSFVEETATRCGHIFCKICIKTAVRRRAKCPVCREKITSRGLIRVFLPYSS